MKLFSSALLLLFSLTIGAKQTRPNIVWITCEDISPYIGAYGNSLVKTPNIDSLAKEGTLYTRVYTTSGVCAPSRSSIITGMYPTSIGTQHMRTKSANSKYIGAGVPNYSAIIPDYVKAFPEYLRKVGYYTTNNQKEDYQFDVPVTVWNESSSAATFLNRPDSKPFFSVFNLFATHESQIMKEPDTLRVDPSKVLIPAYYEDTKIVRKDFANLFTKIEQMDANVGEIIKLLKKNGLYDNSYIFFFSDHGGSLPWMKREILERGTHIPLIIKFPKNEHAKEVVTDLISTVDFAPTVLSLAGIEPPMYLQGEPFLGEFATSTKRKYVFAGRDRMDQKYDRVRAVRNKRYRYIYNYMPNVSRYQDITYRKGIPSMMEILDLKKSNGIKNPYLAAWFETPKAVEELYDVQNDPDEVHNLATDTKYGEILKELREVFQSWTNKVGDMSSIPEVEMVVANWWNGAEVPPVTAKPKIIETENGFVIKCNTKGASVGYRIIEQGAIETVQNHTITTWDSDYVFNRKENGATLQVPPSWKVYDGGEIFLNKGDRLIINAMRIGYEPSIVEYLK